jgi:UV DNA damage endonuclease
MNIGYACIAIAVQGSDLKSCTLKNANKERLLSLIGHNLSALERMIDYNAQNGIKLFRISSDLIPFGSGPAAELPWQKIYMQKLSCIGEKIVNSGMRVSMHPGQYTVLNSIDGSVAERAILDLNYHAGVLDALGLGSEHKLVLHTGGIYGNKTEAKNRFLSNYRYLDPAVRKRLVLENDDTMFNIKDVLEISAAAGIPVVYDNLHNAVNPADPGKSDLDWIRLCAATWKSTDGLQKIHYSQQSPAKKPGAHSGSIQISTFLDFYSRLSGVNIDIMLEVKDKNLSALKCINCVSDRGIHMLEEEWARYKYCILERSPEIYENIRELLCDKTSYPALKMYRMIEAAFKVRIAAGNAVNAAQHVWEYFEDKVSENEKKRFERLMKRFISGEASMKSVKSNLLLLAKRYDGNHLLGGYYFYN